MKLLVGSMTTMNSIKQKQHFVFVASRKILKNIDDKTRKILLTCKNKFNITDHKNNWEYENLQS